MSKQEHDKTIYFMGIGGTGMAAAAGLMQQAGFTIIGSDQGIYPPMSTMLNDLKIPVLTPYSEKNLKSNKPSQVVIANALSRGHVEVEYAIDQQLSLTSFPKLLGEEVLAKKIPLVVAGTHGKTTTSSLLAYTLKELGEKPGYLIGGIPENFTRSFDLGEGDLFVIEGDEYDTAFFDKESKFLHYRPKHLIFNNLEFDHADIFKSMKDIDLMFEKLLNLVKNQRLIAANIDDPGVARLLGELGLTDKVKRVSTLAKTQDADIVVKSLDVTTVAEGEAVWQGTLISKKLGELSVRTSLAGKHNMANIAQVIAVIESLDDQGELCRALVKEDLTDAIASFSGVKRRLDHLYSKDGIDIYEDFAHHPTAVGLVIESFKKAYPEKNLWVAFEPRNATARRNIFLDKFAEGLKKADHVLIGECPEDKRIAPDQKMDTGKLAQQVGSHGKSFSSNDELKNFLEKNLTRGDAVLFMSSGSFSGVQHKLVKALSGSLGH